MTPPSQIFKARSAGKAHAVREQALIPIPK